MGEEILETDGRYFQKCVHFFNVNRNVELSFIQSGHHVTEPGYQYGPLIRDHYLVHFIKSGKGKLYLHNMVYKVQAGNCFLIYPNQIAYYQADSNDPWEYYWLGISGVMSENIFHNIGFNYKRMVLPFKSSEIYSTIENITEEGIKHETEEGKHDTDEIAIYLQLGSLLRKVLYYLMEDNRSNNEVKYRNPEEDMVTVMGNGKYADRYVNIVAKIIQNSYSQDIRVEQIAEKLNINRSYLSATFKKNTGLSIKEFLISYRIDQSCVLLRDKYRPIAEISSAVGYDDPLYFSRLFKKQVGCSPSEYRNRI
ncbi:MAG: DNA-binding protein AraC-type [Eubacterium sp.]|jgi:AraC-like DNA-binding protein|nr:DNA-binding protein AraC-type [Eubacterium sp.]